MGSVVDLRIEWKTCPRDNCRPSSRCVREAIVICMHFTAHKFGVEPPVPQLDLYSKMIFGDTSHDASIKIPCKATVCYGFGAAFVLS
jgi:hypothetical protein